MRAQELLGRKETAALDAVRGGMLRSRTCASQVHVLADDPAGEFLLHEALRRCERAGLVNSRRDGRGRRYSLTPAGRAKIRSQHAFAHVLLGLLARSR